MAVPVTLRALSKHFGATIAVDRIDLDIPAGALFFLLGPSGCGKTTLLRMLAGFADPTGGSIRFGDRDVTHLPPDKRNTGMCFQSYALWPHMSVSDNVAFGLKVRKVTADAMNQRVNQALEMVQMGKYAQRKPNELSGGQQQRVALARALVIQPDLLLLDEPLSNLDAKLRLEMRSQIRRICKDANITAVYVTHDQKEALSMADHMAVLRDGKIMQQGTPGSLYQRPASRFVADFLGESNFYEAKVQAVQGSTLTLDTPIGLLRSLIPTDHVGGNGLSVGSVVTCSIRPEAVRVLREGETVSDDHFNQITAARRESVYLGEMAQHQLLLGETQPMKVFELNPRGEAAQADATLRLAVDPRDVVVVRD